MARKYLNSIGQVLKGDRGNYIKLQKEVSLPKGAVLSITPVQTYMSNLVTRGVIDEAEAERRLGSLPDFVLSIVDASYEEGK